MEIDGAECYGEEGFKGEESAQPAMEKFFGIEGGEPLVKFLASTDDFFGEGVEGDFQVVVDAAIFLAIGD